MTACGGPIKVDSERLESRRQECRRCLRPRRVCVCQALPVKPLRLRGQVLILQHPHELKKRLATVPLLRCCLDQESLHVVTGRKLQQTGMDATTDAVLAGATLGTYPLYVLFPGAGAQDLRDLTEQDAHIAALQRAAARRIPRGGSPATTASQVAPEPPRELRPNGEPAHGQQRQEQEQEQEQGCAQQVRMQLQGQQEAQEQKVAQQDRSEEQPGRQQEPQQTTVVRTPQALPEPQGRSDGPVTSSTGQSQEQQCRSEGATVNSSDGGNGGGCYCVQTTAGDAAVAMATVGTSFSGLNDGGVNGAAATCHGPAAAQSPLPLPPPSPAYLLVVVDGTWRQAKEMYRAVATRCLLPSGPGVQVALRPADVFPVQLECGGQDATAASAAQAHADPVPPEVSTLATDLTDPSQHVGQRCCWNAPGDMAGGTVVDKAMVAAASQPDSGRASAEPTDPWVGEEGGMQAPLLTYDPNMPCLIRKEPMAGFVTTYEATARALGLLERDPQLAAELLAPLRLMTRLQASFSPSVRARMHAEHELT